MDDGGMEEALVVVILFPAMQATGIMAEYFRASKHPKTLNIQVYTVVNKYNAIFRTFFSLRLSQVKIWAAWPKSAE